MGGGAAEPWDVPTPDDALVLRNLFDGADEVIYVKDRLSRFVRVSVGCARLHGRTQEQMVGLTDHDLFEPRHANAARADEERVMATGEPMLGKVEQECWADRPDTWVSSSKFPLRADDGTVIGTFGISRDITPRIAAEQELRRVEAQLRAVLDGSTDEIARYDADLRFAYLNPAAERARGVRAEDLLGRRDRDCGMGLAVLSVWEPALRRVLDTGEAGEVELERTDDDGRTLWSHTTLSPDLSADGTVVGVLASTRDITAMKVAEAALAHRATHDALTGLANRTLVLDRIEAALARTARRPGLVAVFFVDVDGFKAVNDTFGHETGDAVLVEVGRRLTTVARRDDTVGRLAGDEFVVVCEGVPDEAHAERIARRIVEVVRAPVPGAAASGAPSVSVSVGVCLAADDRPDAVALLTRADAAMYEVKRAGRDGYRVAEDVAGSPGDG